MDDNTKKGIAGIMLATTIGGASVVIDNSVVTDKEIYTSVNEAIIDGKIPQIELEKVSLDRVAEAYTKIAIENGIDLSLEEDSVNLYDRIREEKQSRGETLQEKTYDVLEVQ